MVDDVLEVVSRAVHFRRIHQIVALQYFYYAEERADVLVMRLLVEYKLLRPFCIRQVVHVSTIFIDFFSMTNCVVNFFTSGSICLASEVPGRSSRSG